MRKFIQWIGMAMLGVLFVAGTASAQSNTNNNAGNNGRRGGRGNGGGGNFDPAQMQQRFLDNIKDRLGFTNDTEWAAVQPLVQKVLDARREQLSNMGFGRFGGGRAAGGGESGENRGGGNGFFRQSPEAESLQKLIDDKVPAAELKTAMEKYRAARKDKEAKLEAAQTDLQKVLTVRQEAQAALMGLVP